MLAEVIATMEATIAANASDAIRFNTPPSIYWDDAAKISHIQQRVAVYSIMYYQMDASCVSDTYYNKVSQQLLQYHKRCSPAQVRRSRYYYAFKDFDGSTGFDIPSRLTEGDLNRLTQLAQTIYNRWQKQGGQVIV